MTGRVPPIAEPPGEDPRLAGLSPEKRELLLRRLRERAAAAASVSIQPRSGSGPGPLSYAQELLWLLTQLHPESPAFNVPSAIRLRGPLDERALQGALDALVRRHQVFRTRVRIRAGVPEQVPSPSEPVPVQRIDLADFGALDRDQALATTLQKLSRAPFDLSRDLLLRAAIIRLGPDDCVLTLCTHHIASDGWSQGILHRELASSYADARAGAPEAPPPLRIQYLDYAEWQRGFLDGSRLEALLAFWRGELAGAPEMLALPTDFPRPAEAGDAGGKESRALPPALSEALLNLGRRHGASEFMVVMALFQALLYRYSGDSDLVVGSPISGREPPETEALIGYFTNALPFRGRVESTTTFTELLTDTRNAALRAFEHRSLPFEKLVVELRKGRPVQESPIFQVLLVMNDGVTAPFELPGLQAEPVAFERGWAKFDLSLYAGRGTDGLGLRMEYRSELFTSATIRRMLEHFERLASAAVADPDATIGGTALTSAEETAQLLEWSRGPRAAEPTATLPALFASRVAATPAAPAVLGPAVQWSYAELDARANRLANLLRARGVDRGVVVGVHLSSSPALAAALLGVLKAGGVCLPLDPGYPDDRLRLMVADAGAALVLTAEQLAGQPLVSADRTIQVDHAETFAALPITAPVTGTAPDDIAYLLYTSGSTGVPKGVLLSHRGLANHQRAAVDIYGLTPSDRMLQFASVSFDICLEELFPTWLAGGTVVFRPAELPLMGPTFREWLVTERITVLDLPTAYWQEWVSQSLSAGLDLPPGVRLVILGGDRVTGSALARWRDWTAGRVRLMNTYGPTEASVIVTAHECGLPGPTLAPLRDPPIGRPIAGTAVYLLDAADRPVPVGIPGELCIGGVGVAAGYLNRPELTAERFVPDPFTDRAESLMYRTGDFARFRTDGTIEFLGRRDQQIKIRGFRVELPEIEMALRALPEVREAVVTTGETAGVRSLVAHVVLQPADASPAALLQQLRLRLPDYMVPSAIVAHERLPLTPNGKLDRKALEEAGIPAAERIPSRAPATELERLVASVWTTVLRQERPGVDDDFFLMGGNSLLGIQVLARLEAFFRFPVPLRSLFDAPTISGLIESLRAREPSPGHCDRVAALAARVSRLSADEARMRLGAPRPAALETGRR